MAGSLKRAFSPVLPRHSARKDWYCRLFVSQRWTLIAKMFANATRQISAEPDVFVVEMNNWLRAGIRHSPAHSHDGGFNPGTHEAARKLTAKTDCN
jgi:hypothetical protein